MGFLRGWLFDNLGLKFVALLLAVLIYLNVYTDRPATMVVSFPLQLTDLADSLALSGPVPSAVQAEVRGSGKQLIRLRLREPMLKVSLEKVGTGHYERTIGAADLPLGGEAGPQLERLIGPMMLDLEIERRFARHVPVAARVEGVPADGFEWTGEAHINPDRVELSGPHSAVAALDSVRLTVVSLDGARDSVRVTVTPDHLPDWCESKPARIQVTLPVRHSGD
jgi:YbbR domain-containing protein